MGNFKKVKLLIELTGEMYTTDENNIANWGCGLLEKEMYEVKKIEIIEEYDLSPQLIEYFISEEYDPTMEEKLGDTLKIQRRELKITSVLQEKKAAKNNEITR